MSFNLNTLANGDRYVTNLGKSKKNLVLAHGKGLSLTDQNSITTSNVIDISSDLTLSFYMELGSTDVPMWVGSYVSDTDRFIVGQNSINEVIVSVGDTSAVFLHDKNGPVLITVTLDSTVSTAYLYLDGVYLNSVTWTGGTNTGFFKLSSDTNPLVGVVKDFLLFYGFIDATTVSNLYQTPEKFIYSNGTGLVSDYLNSLVIDDLNIGNGLWVPMCEYTGDLVHDIVGNTSYTIASYTEGCRVSDKPYGLQPVVYNLDTLGLPTTLKSITVTAGSFKQLQDNLKVYGMSIIEQTNLVYSTEYVPPSYFTSDNGNTFSAANNETITF